MLSALATKLSWVVNERGGIPCWAISAFLLRLQAMYQRVFHSQQRNFYLLGESNNMADACSRL